MTTSIASIHFPPTKQARKNLLNEGVSEENIVVVGNTVIDALLLVSNGLDQNDQLQKIEIQTFVKILHLLVKVQNF